jgi:carbohydrate-selective porin OprB
VERVRPACVLRSALAFVAACVAMLGSPARGQQTTQAPGSAPQTAQQSTFECQHPADPHRRPRNCNGQDFGWDETLAGEWDKFRNILKKIGVTPSASYVSALQTNASGGDHQVWSYAGQLSVGLSADLAKLARLPGLSAYVGISWGTGSDLSSSVGSLIPTSGLYAPSLYLGEMYLQQTLWENKVTILAGRLAASNAFASLPAFTNYVNYGINPNPFSIGANDITFFGPPTGTEWGAQASYAVTRAIQVAAGAFNTNVNSANGENHGADFTVQEGNKGLLAVGEIDYFVNQGTTATGKPGEIVVGFLHSNNSFPSLADPATRNDGYSGEYVMAQQMIYRPGGPGTARGATVWASWTMNSKDIINPVPLSWGVGANYQGLIRARPHDIVSVGVVSTQASKYAQPVNSEKLMEINYQWNHSRFLTITPHFQYLLVGESPQTRNATVVGMQLALAL